MLPAGVVKGGTSIRIRLGNAHTRFSQDVDVSTADDYGIFLDQLDDKLKEGWGGFEGTIQTRPQASPDGIPEQYVMQPAVVRLTYLGGSVGETVLLELGPSEVGSAEVDDKAMPDDILSVFRALGLPDPAPVPVMEVHHQIAQKLHACTYMPPSGVNGRAHDLVDLQLLVAQHEIDLKKLDEISARLFEYRRAQIWPPRVEAHDGWEDLYQEASRNLDVLSTVAEAVDWSNELIDRIQAAGR